MAPQPGTLESEEDKEEDESIEKDDEVVSRMAFLLFGLGSGPKRLFLMKLIAMFHFYGFQDPDPPNP